MSSKRQKKKVLKKQINRAQSKEASSKQAIVDKDIVNVPEIKNQEEISDSNSDKTAEVKRESIPEAVISKRELIIRCSFFPALFMLMELAFHLYCYGTIDGNIVFAMLFSGCYGLFAAVLTSFFTPWVNKLVAWVLLGITVIAFCLQVVYSHIFKTYISLYSVQQNAGDASQFWREALHGILESWFALILLLVIPIAALAIMLKKRWLVLSQVKITKSLITLGGSAVIYVIVMLCLPAAGTDAHTAYDLYHDNWLLDLGIEKLGIMTSTTFDVKSVLFGTMEEIDIEETQGMSALVLMTPTPTPQPTSTPTPLPVITEIVTRAPEASATPTPTPTATPTPTPTPIDTSPNVLDIDFTALAEAEEDSGLKKIHEYMAVQEPTKKNEYTGMFEGYNLIFMTAEGFSPWAVDEEITPTFYKLLHEGFVFNNFYTPIWYTSTSDGEYVACTGLIPYSTNSFKRSKNNSLPFCMGWQFLKLGYTAKAWHAHTATYYGREFTHPNMGYVFKGKKAGLAITDTWPESDLEMMELTVPEYINDEKFHVYYMTVSGHLEYNFSGNYQAKKNKSYVENLPYSDAVKAYIACNKEFDLALEYLISELEKAGVADKTVIAFSADHYPYGLTDEQLNEVAGHTVEKQFELYKNHFVLWSPSIKEPIVIDKYCSSLDIMPTLSNLFGLEFDSRLFMGHDILSDTPALVMFSNQSFITDYCMYNASSKEITMLQDVELPEGYISSVNKIIRNKFEVSKNILLKDYYSTIMDYIPDVVTEVSPEGTAVRD